MSTVHPGPVRHAQPGSSSNHSSASSTTPARASIGTSGWVYRHWRGRFYPERLATKYWLECYAESFDCVEVNGSFYRLPTRETFADWAARTPTNFRFAVKGSRFITHLKRLTEPSEHVTRFFEAATGLGEKLGPVLWQLPPNFRRDDARLEGFLAVLPRSAQHTIEFRHESWLVDPVLDLLRQHGVALTIPDHPKLPRALILTAPWTFIRFHYGPSSDGDYPPSALDHWAAWIRERVAENYPVWAFFNNDWQGYAPANARELIRRLEGSARSPHAPS